MMMSGADIHSGNCMNLELKQRFFWEVLMGSFVNQLRL